MKAHIEYKGDQEASLVLTPESESEYQAMHQLMFKKLELNQVYDRTYWFTIRGTSGQGMRTGGNVKGVPWRAEDTSYLDNPTAQAPNSYETGWEEHA